MNTVETDLAGRGAMSLNPPGSVKRTSPLRPLVSHERAQKFDLLLHLISNLQDGIIICGPKGIGKSTVLDLIQAETGGRWTVCRIDASSATRGEDVLGALSESISADQGGGVQQSDARELRDHLARFKRDGRLLVLLLDDAGEMLPGNLTAICQFADANPVLRPVFTMTADRLHLALSSDPAIANCQVIEIPPLTESQCGEFLQNLSGKPGALISFKAITPVLIQHVYRESHGVPGNVVSMLPGLSQRHLVKTPISSLPLVGTIVLIVAMLLGYGLWKQSDESSVLEKLSSVSDREAGRKSTPIPLGKDPERVEPEAFVGIAGNAKSPVAGPRLQPGGAGSTGLGGPSGSGLSKSLSPDFPEKPSSVLPNTEKDFSGAKEDSNPPELNSTSRPMSPNSLSGPDAARSDAGESQPVPKSGSLIAKPGMPVNPKPGGPAALQTGTGQSGAETRWVEPASATTDNLIEGKRGSQWIRQQDTRRFTLQLMAGTRLDAIKRFLNSHARLDGVAIFRTRKNGTAWYALIIGTYPSLNAARQAAKTLPSGLRNAWPRSFQSVQKAMVDSDPQ